MSNKTSGEDPLLICVEGWLSDKIWNTLFCEIAAAKRTEDLTLLTTVKVVIYGTTDYEFSRSHCTAVELYVDGTLEDINFISAHTALSQQLQLFVADGFVPNFESSQGSSTVGDDPREVN